MASLMVKAEPRYRATFEWWVLRNKYGEELSGSPRGPFEVEVFFDNQRGTKKGKWVAQVLPTCQRIPGQHKTEQDTFNYVRSLFREQLTKWTVEG
jgi:hypothetical protein